jgi:hypothetical protein
MKPEIKKAIENLWDHRNIHLGDERVPCDAEILSDEIIRLEDVIEKQRMLFDMAIEELTRLQDIVGSEDCESIQKVIDASNEMEGE